MGSVGTRAWVALFVGGDNDDTLILQAKEAEASVLERFVGKSAFDNHGQRVVEGQRLMQAASDIFLGWHRVTRGADGRPHDYYFRQLWDWKLSAAVETMSPELLGAYAQLCGWTLARAHARSGDAVAIGSYLGQRHLRPGPGRLRRRLRRPERRRSSSPRRRHRGRQRRRAKRCVTNLEEMASTSGVQRASPPGASRFTKG